MSPRPFLIRPSLSAALLVLLLAGCSRGPGVAIEVLQEGDGPQVKAGDYITAHYTLTLEDGTLVESSRPERGGDGPLGTTIGAGAVIEGWDRGIVRMRVGERSRLTIPGELAYGERGSGQIPPNATLVFEVEVLESNSGPHVERSDGIVYDILTEGRGKVVQRGDEITAHYTLWLPDGRMLQSTREDRNGDGIPYQQVIELGNVIAGWVRGIPGMRVGETRRLKIPSNFAYGEAGGGGGAIPPNTDLTFELEILSTRTAPR